MTLPAEIGMAIGTVWFVLAWTVLFTNGVWPMRYSMFEARWVIDLPWPVTFGVMTLSMIGLVAGPLMFFRAAVVAFG